MALTTQGITFALVGALCFYLLTYVAQTVLSIHQGLRCGNKFTDFDAKGCTLISFAKYYLSNWSEIHTTIAVPAAVLQADKLMCLCVNSPRHARSCVSCWFYA